MKIFLLRKGNNSYQYTVPFLLLISMVPPAAYAKDNKDNDVTYVTVTGSRISKAQKEGVSPITIITASDIDKQGFSNAYEALNNLSQNTGVTTGADGGNTFTPAANTISLKGLGPNHTLILINGQRVADYPTAYSGSVNFVNLANIPSAIIDRIEILSSGASAIYGSDAIAGVVNIILKKTTDGTQINFKAGSTIRAGENARLQLTGSKDWNEKLHTVYAIELSGKEPIWASDRPFMSDTSALGENKRNIAGRKNATTGRYLSIGGCDRLSGLFNGSVVSYGSSTDNCATGLASPSYWTIQTKNRSQNAYIANNYIFNDNLEFYANGLIGFSQLENNTRGPAWTSLSREKGYFYNKNSGLYETWSRRIAPEEVGGRDTINSKWNDISANINLGLKGNIEDTSWKYEVGYTGSIYTSEIQRKGRLLNNVDNYFLGEELGRDQNNIPIYAPDVSKLNTPLTVSEFQSFTSSTTEKDKSWSQTLSFSTTGNVFKLPAGDAKIAVIAELGRQGFTIEPDTALQSGAFYSTSSQGKYGGIRDRQALGTELYLPLLKNLNGTISGRYDRYAVKDSAISKFTFGSGLEFRPASNLLLRTNYATSFRAPDMNYVFLQKQNGYYSSTTDYLRCEQSGQPLSDCEYASVSPGSDYTLTGNSKLQPEDGSSFGAGIVWSPKKSIDLSVDYWNVKINNLVTNLSADKLLRTEADCQAGRSEISSAQCQDALTRIQRNPSDALINPGAIKNINVQPINAATTQVSGIDVATKWRFGNTQLGQFVWAVNYSYLLSNKYKQSSSDNFTNSLKDMSDSDWRDRFNTSLSWSKDKFTSTILVNRFGKIPNGDGSAYLKPTFTVNLSGGYKLSDQLSASIIVNNLFNKIKKDDTAGWPYYPVSNYSAYGRQAWLEVNYKF